jgi:hypothetical protein
MTVSKEKYIYNMPISSGHCAYLRKNEVEISRYYLTKETLASPQFVDSAKRPSPGRTLRYRNICKNLEQETKQNFESRANRSARMQSREKGRRKVSATEHRKF